MYNFRMLVWCVLILISFSFFTGISEAVTFCADSAASLQDALTNAAYNGQDDIVKVVQGTYTGNFIYASLEANDLTMEGGYTFGCSSRTVHPSNTVLDGNFTGHVLILSTNQPAYFTVEGFTLRNGNPAVNPSGGGIYVYTEDGSVTLTLNIIDNNDASNDGGGAFIDVGYYGTVMFTDNIASNNTANWRGGGVSITGYYGGSVTFSGNTLNMNTSNNNDGGGAYIRVGTLEFSNNIVNSNTSNWEGGGVFLDTDFITVVDNTISDNTASSGEGGGIYFRADESSTLTGNIVRNNSAGGGNGGGIYFDYGFYNTLILTNNIINDNTSSLDGGGLYFDRTGDTTLTNNTLCNNTANGSGGGMFLRTYYEEHIVSLHNNIIWNNNALVQATDLYIDNDSDNDFIPSLVTLFNNDFDQSQNGFYVTLPIPIDSSNLNNVDPLFFDWPNGDYHLTESSPVIDRGDNGAPEIPVADKDGNQRIIDTNVDMGAYERGSCAVFFSDVQSGHWAIGYISKIACEGIASGCGGGQYCPANSVSRAQMAAFIIRALEGDPSPGYCGGQDPFIDVSSDHWACGHIKRLSELGISSGYPDGTYRPTYKVSRAEMAIYIIRALYGDSFSYSGTPYFSDVPDSHWAFKYIQRIYEDGISTGYQDGTYRPTHKVSRAEMAVYVTRAFL